MVRRRKYGFSFSWKRAIGLSGARARIAQKTGIPTTRSGLERKIGRTLLKGSGCCIAVAAAGAGAVVLGLLLA